MNAPTQQTEIAAHPARITLLHSSSTHLALIFSILIIAAIALVSYQFYLFRIGVTPDPWLIQGALALLLVIAIGLFVVGFYVTKRINNIVETADRIMHTGDISQRIAVYQRWDDLSTLSHTLNRMLAEIESLVGGIRTVSDNIAHDLRHPLAHLRNGLEELRKSNHASGDMHQREQIAHLLQECDMLLSMFSGLLRISAIESTRRHSGFASLDLSRVLHDVIELYEPLAHESSITILVNRPEHAKMHGDKDLLFQAIANLVDNAIKYSPDTATVRITLSVADAEIEKSRHGITLTIEDEGCGIAPEHRSNVFKRFYRGEACRSTAGNGLGLALVRAIIDLHQGTIRLSDSTHAGLCVTICL
jgi:signal transduction histidine kinase